MATLALSPDELLCTTRAVRKRLDFDRPVPLELVRECLEIALQAPTGTNAQGWHFVVVTDPGAKERIGSIYRELFRGYLGERRRAERREEAGADPEEARQLERVLDSAAYLAENLHRVPVLVIPCIEGRVDDVPPPGASIARASLYGSILPAVWSFMLAARARGLGTVLTTLHLAREEEVATLLGIPVREVTQVALVPVAFTRGTTFRPARRRPLDRVLHLERW